MIKFSLISLIALFLFQACAQEIKTVKKKIIIPKHEITFSLNDYLKENTALDKEVDAIFAALDDTAIVAQLIMPAVGKYGQTEALIKQHIKERIIGGVLMLNGTKDGFTKLINQFEKMNDSIGNIPFLYSADAEPSLVNNKIKGSTIVKKANEIKTIEEVQSCAKKISSDLNAIGINYNFSPVVDMSSNSTVGYRGFGANPANIVPWSNAFIQETQNKNIIATAKHFPGHGLVTGDTHKSLQVIDGELKEIHNYPGLIEKGVLSIMVAHIAVKNNPKFDTKGLPSTLSETIVKQLLRDSLNFKGIIVTDAMNMGGVVSVPESAYKAVNAGCDILLMPVDAKKSHSELLAKYKSNPEFKEKVNTSAKRIIRMKVCAGLLKK
jgi:beta-N-acetylhexosaminidase